MLCRVIAATIVWSISRTRTKASAASIGGECKMPHPSYQNPPRTVAACGEHPSRRIDPVTHVITTVAGRGAAPRDDGTIGDGGPATDAFLGGPWALLIAGNSLYISEDAYNGNRIRKVDLTTGTITTIAGSVDGESGSDGDGGLAKAAKLNGPEGSIVRDSAGNLYFSDTGNHRVRRIDTNGIITTYAGGSPPDFDSPTALAFDLSGNLLIATLERVHRVDKSSGAMSTVLT